MFLTKYDSAHKCWGGVARLSMELNFATSSSREFVSKLTKIISTWYSSKSEIRTNMSTCYSHNFKNRFVKLPLGKVWLPKSREKNSTNQPVNILFQQKWHDFCFPFRVNYSKLEMRISTIISKKKIQAKGFRMIQAVRKSFIAIRRKLPKRTKKQLYE